MDTAFATRVFKSLFGTCYRERSLQALARRSCPHNRQALRSIATYRQWKQGRADAGRKGAAADKKKDDAAIWKPRKSELTPEEMGAFEGFGHTTAAELRLKNRKPRRIKMSMRDFIEDSLYNPTYGYFSSQAVIYDPEEPIRFNELADEPAFYHIFNDRYRAFEDRLDEQERNEKRQLWHTPTTLFRPHYAQAIARYFIENYKLALYPYHDLIIYEMGAGNGVFMQDVLDYIREWEPEVYERTKYKIIEISPALATLQKSRVVLAAEAKGHADKLEVINKSIFEWNQYVRSPCFFVALEVIDNFGHDVIRWDLKTGKPLQGKVVIDTAGDMYEYFTPQTDRTLARFLRVRNAACETVPDMKAVRRQSTRRSILDGDFFGLSSDYSKPPTNKHLSDREYVPTRLMEFFDILNTYFPGHRLVCSDFTYLPSASPGVNAPIVQTRHKRQMVPVSTPLVEQGFFDIFFPTNFETMSDIYRAVTGKLTQIDSHEQFMRRWAYLEDTETKNGENPLLTHYENASFMTTV